MRNIFKVFFIICFIILTNNCFSQHTKNIILMIGDGMGFNHIEACNNFYNEKQDYQNWESYHVSTYPKEGFYNSDSAYADFNFVKKRYTDSGAAATALSTGYKTHNGVIGLNENYYVVQNLTEYAEEMGKSTGVVSTVPFCHATPAGFVAHVDSRYLYKKIASQMLIDSKLDVIIGCGNPNYDNNGNIRDIPKYKYIPELLFKDIKSGKTMITDDEGNKRMLKSSDKDNISDPWTFVSSLSEFEELSAGNNIPDRLFGLPEVYSTLQESRDSKNKNEKVPDLETLSLAALNVLNQNDKGFFLMIEGGAIDWASHDSLFVRAIEETNDFNKAVKTISDWVEKNSSWEETIVIITADHETGYLTNSLITAEEFNKMNSKDLNLFVPNNKTNSSKNLKFNQAGGDDKCEHTNQLVPLFIKGTGREMFNKRAKYYKEINLNYDKLSKSYYIDNTDIAKIIFELLDR